jgi:hypothetical protein
MWITKVPNVENLVAYVENQVQTVDKYPFFCGKVRFSQKLDRLHGQDREKQGSSGSGKRGRLTR